MVLKLVINLSPGGAGRCVVEDLYRVGRDARLFQKNNAYLEGVTIYGDSLLLAAERDPRGVITVAATGDIGVFVQPPPHFSSAGLSYDFTGLEVFRGRVFALDRNQYEVCERMPPRFVAKRCHSFKSAALSEAWAYSTGKYGLVEGLAMDEHNLWIIVDNNGDARLDDPEDRRPVLMKFKNPFSDLSVDTRE